MKKKLLVMSKSPVLGYAKTRMQPDLTKEQSLKLHVALVQYCLKQWLEAEDFSISIWVGGNIDVFRTDVLTPMDSY
ncbi:MAG: glycosyltransferase A (GT-A) superfamily protein (DUF2064 family), partial [Candidatus Endobugula sp.]